MNNKKQLSPTLPLALRALALLALIIMAEVVNGTVRTLAIAPLVGDFTARQALRGSGWQPITTWRRAGCWGWECCGCCTRQGWRRPCGTAGPDRLAYSAAIVILPSRT